MIKRIVCIVLLFLILAPARSINFPNIDGWTVESPAREYRPDNLWNAINGAAANFLRYGFEKMEAVRYMRQDSAYINVEVYKHSSPENAFGIYAQERPRRDLFGTIGAQSYAEPGLLNLLTGNYYIKINSHVSDSTVENAMIQIARQLVILYDQPPGLPDILGWFPVQDKRPNSEQYIDRNFLDIPEFGHVFQADYASGSNTSQLFVISFSSATEAHEALTKYLNSASNSFGPDPFEHTNPNYGPILWVEKGSFLAGAMNYTSKGKTKKILSQLRLALP